MKKMYFAIVALSFAFFSAYAQQPCMSLNFTQTPSSAQQPNCNGFAQVFVNGGQSPYKYKWNGDSTLNVNQRNNLCNGSYNVEVRDSLGCFQSINVNVGNPPCINIQTYSLVSSTANAPDCNGTAGIDVSGGQPPYKFRWNGDSTLNVSFRNNLCNGNYNVEVRDSLGCFHDINFNLGGNNQGPCMSLNFTQTPSSAQEPNCNGFAQVFVNGGQPPYKYKWNGDSTLNVSQRNNLCNGSYNVEVRDSLGCFQNININVGNNQGPCMSLNFTQTPSSAQEPNCNGFAQVFVNGGQPPYKYKWNGDSTLNVSQRNNLCNGNYNVEVRDSLGCFQNININVGNNQGPCMSLNFTQTPSSAQEPNCNGFAQVFVNGGQPPYKYKWNGDSTLNVSQRNNLCNGNYNVEVRDSQGCYQNININLGGNNGGGSNNNDKTTCPSSNGNPGFEAHAIATNANKGQCNAYIEFITFGGKAPFTYKLNGDIIGGKFAQGKCAGAYAIEVLDSTGCRSWDSVYIYEFDNAKPCDSNKFKAYAIGSPTSATNTCFGSLEGFADGGRPPYTYTWTNLQSGTFAGKLVKNICLGRYILSITDSAGCVANSKDTVNIEVKNNGGGGNNGGENDDKKSTCPEFEAHAIAPNTNPGKCDSKLEFITFGGTLPFTYKLGTATVNKVVENVCKGQYYIEVIDGKGCRSWDSTYVEEINPNKPCDSTKFTAHAMGKPASGPNACDGSAEGFAIGGRPPYTYTWQSTASTATRTGKMIGNLCVGNYLLVIRDSANCVAKSEDTANVEVKQYNGNPCIDFKAVGNTYDEINDNCKGVASVKVDFFTSPLKFVWADDSTKKSGNRFDLCSGTYTLTVMDAKGCDTSLVLSVNNKVEAANSDPCKDYKIYTKSTLESGAAKCDATAEVIVNGGKKPFTYTWAGKTSSVASIKGLCNGNQLVTVVDSNNCTLTDTAKIATLIQNDPCVNFKTSMVVTNLTKYGANDGVVKVISQGGNPTYSYKWNTSRVNADENANVAAGWHYVIVKDSKGCTKKDSAYVGIDAPPADPCEFFNVSLITFNAATAASCDGYIEAAIKGGAVPYSVIWKNGDGSTDESTTSLERTNVCSGKYGVVVTDANTCTVIAYSAVGVNPPKPPAPAPTSTVQPLKIFVYAQDATNAELCNGRAKAEVVGGVPPYKFKFGADSTSNNTGVFTKESLCGGFYTMFVTDNQNITKSFVFVIGSPKTTYTPPNEEFKDSIAVDTAVSPAIQTCSIEYDSIDSIRIATITKLGTDSISAAWNVYHSGTTTTINQNYYVGGARNGLFSFVLDLFCTFRASGNARGVDYVYIDTRSTSGGDDLSSIADVDDASNTAVYPNPFDNTLTITTTNPSSVEIVDLYGRVVYSGNTSGKTTVDTERLSSGVYIVSITSDAGKTVKKLVKR
jgi:hypothetical protein